MELTRDETLKALEMFQADVPMRQIAVALDRKPTTFNDWLRRQGWSRPRLQRGAFNARRKLGVGLDMRPVKADPEKLWRRAMAGQRFEDVRVKPAPARLVVPDVVEGRAI